MQNPPQQAQPQRTQPPAPAPPTPEERRRSIMRIAMMQALAALCTFAGLNGLAYFMPFFLFTFVGAIAGIALNIVVIVRAATSRAPVIFYFLAAFGILVSFFLLLMGLAALVTPQYWDLLTCTHNALTDTDRHACQAMQSSFH